MSLWDQVDLFEEQSGRQDFPEGESVSLFLPTEEVPERTIQLANSVEEPYLLDFASRFLSVQGNQHHE